jgi:SAM-dependent methyltransferase
MFHHSLEHMPDQEKVLRQAAKLLRPGGVCLVRIPVFPSFAWDRYRENWVQLDAPRHLFVHSRKSLGIIAKQAGLEIERVDFDSTEFQFTGSELYSRGLALSELERAFSRRECRAFRRQARQLNRDERGDQAVFFLRKAG